MGERLWADMHLRFTDEELGVLLEMVSLASLVASWNRKPEAEEGVAAFEALENKILERAAHAGFGDIIEFDEESQSYGLTNEYLEKAFAHECYEEFRNESFWEELMIRMADRDFLKKRGAEAWEAIPEEERREIASEEEKRYWDEFASNGVEHVHVIAPHGAG